ncbi:MAG: segregation and condensation protein A [Candidatus Omnitrophota bacterium]
MTDHEELAQGPAPAAPEEPKTPPAPPAAEGVPAEPAKVNPLHVKITSYDGPLDLLLDLIKNNEMDIYDIRISEITDQYLAYLAKMKQLDLEIAGEFIVMAATLLYIKSKMLLPPEPEEGEEEGGDPRSELVRKLLEYQAFKEAARELGMLETERGKVFTRQISDYYLASLDPSEAGIDTFSANLYDLLSAFQGVLTRSGRKNLHEVFEEIISIEEKMAEIQALLIEKGKLAFFSLFNEDWTRNELIATFLALLEIVRTKFARVRQEKQFGEILIEKL